MRFPLFLFSFPSSLSVSEHFRPFFYKVWVLRENKATHFSQPNGLKLIIKRKKCHQIKI